MLHVRHGSKWGCCSSGYKGTQVEEQPSSCLWLLSLRGKRDLEVFPWTIRCPGLEMTHITFYSQFIGQNMSRGPTQSSGVQEVQLYCVPIRGDNQKYLLNGIYHSLSTYLVPGCIYLVLRVFQIHLLIPSTILQSRDFYLQLLLGQPGTQRREVACSKLHSE